jgi:hypothetical protein
VTIRDVVFRDIKTTTGTQMRDVHIRDKIIKDCILLGSPLTVGMFSSRIVSCLHPLPRGGEYKRGKVTKKKFVYLLLLVGLEGDDHWLHSTHHGPCVHPDKTKSFKVTVQQQL